MCNDRKGSETEKGESYVHRVKIKTSTERDVMTITRETCVFNTVTFDIQYNYIACLCTWIKKYIEWHENAEGIEK